MASAAAKNKRVTTRIEEVCHHYVDTGGVRLNLTDSEAKWLHKLVGGQPFGDGSAGAVYRALTEALKP